MARREDQDWEPDVYGDPEADLCNLHGMGWVKLTDEQRAAYRAPDMSQRLVDAVQKVIDEWSLP